MSGISSLNNLVPSDVSQAAQSQAAIATEKDKQSDQVASQETFGPPYILNISEDGQPYVSNNTDENATSTEGAIAASPSTPDKAATSENSSNTSASTATSTNNTSDGSSSSKASGGGGKSGGGAAGGGGGAVSVSSDEESSKRKVRPQVGAAGADQVVDKQGNIDQVKLKQLIAQQEQRAQLFAANPTTQNE